MSLKGKIKILEQGYIIRCDNYTLKSLFITTKLIFVNDLYTLMKRQIFRLDKKVWFNYILPTKTCYKMKEINELKKWQKIYHVNKIQKETGLTVLTQNGFQRKKYF